MCDFQFREHVGPFHSARLHKVWTKLHFPPHSQLSALLCVRWLKWLLLVPQPVAWGCRPARLSLLPPPPSLSPENSTKALRTWTPHLKQDTMEQRGLVWRITLSLAFINCHQDVHVDIIRFIFPVENRVWGGELTLGRWAWSLICASSRFLFKTSFY